MTKLRKENQVAIVALSNALTDQMKSIIDELCEVFANMGIRCVLSKYLYQKESVRGASAKNKARELESFYTQDEIKAVFDVSGGDIANEVLCELDFSKIKENPKALWGYSDLTTLINAFYQMGEISTCLYQVRNLVGEFSSLQQKQFEASIMGKEESLFEFEYKFLQGKQMEGIVIGGNIRCFLKLAGTEFMPDFDEKILFLESRSGGVAQMITFLSQYKQLEAFEKVNGILLGSFTEMDSKQLEPTIEEVILEFVDNPDLPIARTKQIGHGQDSKAIRIGQALKLCKG